MEATTTQYRVNAQNRGQIAAHIADILRDKFFSIMQVRPQKGCVLVTPERVQVFNMNGVSSQEKDGRVEIVIRYLEKDNAAINEFKILCLPGTIIDIDDRNIMLTVRKFGKEPRFDFYSIVAER